MNTYNVLFSDKDQFSSFIQKNSIKDSQNNLILVFTSIADKEHIKRVVETIKSVLPQSPMIGTTTAGEICNSQICHESTLISISTFERTRIKTSFVECNTSCLDAGKALRRDVDAEAIKAILVFSDGLKSDGVQFLHGLSCEFPPTTIAGGRAGDAGKLISTYVFDKEHISDFAAVGASLSSDYLQVKVMHNLNWQPIGKVMTVTKSEGTRTYEVDGITVKALYDKYLGTKIASEMPYSCGEFPLLKLGKHDMMIARGVHTVFDDGSAFLGGNLDVGDKVQLGFGNVEMILSHNDSLCDILRQDAIESLFVFNCTSRLNFLQHEAAQQEVHKICDVATNAGFFTYGEYYFNQDQPELLNLTMTMIAMTENPKKLDRTTEINEQNVVTMFSGKHYKILTALTTLITSVTKELEESNIELKRQASVDFLTGVFNRRFFFESGENIFLVARRNKCPLSFCQIDFDDFKKKNDTFGHHAGDELLYKVASTIKARLRKSDLFGRLGGEEFAIVLYDTDCNGALKICDTIRQIIESSTYICSNHSIQMCISVGVSEIYPDDIDLTSVYKRADNALYRAKTTGKNKVVIFKS